MIRNEVKCTLIMLSPLSTITVTRRYLQCQSKAVHDLTLIILANWLERATGLHKVVETSPVKLSQIQR